MVMSEEEYQFALRELPPCKLIQIINKYRDKIHELADRWYIDSADVDYDDVRELTSIVYDLRQVIPEWYEKN